MTQALVQLFASLPRAAVALSGGVDSMTLVAFAQTQGVALEAFHAVSAAVPAEATLRAQALCLERGIAFRVVDAGELSDPRYVKNPADRCYFCKSDLYDAMRRLTDAPLLSGTNTDDLGDIRPGLRAAAERAVRHPFVEAGLDKEAVRALARSLGLGHIAELPAQPCLASRVETGIPIEGPVLRAIDAVEQQARAQLGATSVVRCRVRKQGVVLELDSESLARFSEGLRGALLHHVGGSLRGAGLDDTLFVEPYRMGSAFLRVL